MAGGYSRNPNRFLDSSEMFIEGQDTWTKINGLTLPTVRRGPFMINLNNDVFLTGRYKSTFVSELIRTLTNIKNKKYNDFIQAEK